MAVSFSRTARALDADRNAGARWLLAVALVLLAAWSLWFFGGQVTVHEVSKAARIEVVSASRQVATEQGGRLIASSLHVGRVVRAGEVLARFDSAPQRLRLAEAEARLAGFGPRIAALQAQLKMTRSAGADTERSAVAAVAAARARRRAAEADARFSGALAERQRRDSETGGLAPVDADRAAAEARRAAAASDAARADEGRTTGETGSASATRAADAAAVTEVLAAAQGELAATRALVERLRHEAEVSLIRAPIDGVVGDLAPLKLGEVLAPGTRLATIVPRGDLQIIALFDAARGLGRLNAGQAARLRLDGFAWTQYGDFPARVASVAGEATGAMLRVELRMPRRAEGALVLRHGMTGQVDVMVEQVSPARLVLRTLGQLLA